MPVSIPICLQKSSCEEYQANYYSNRFCRLKDEFVPSLGKESLLKGKIELLEDT